MNILRRDVLIYQNNLKMAKTQKQNMLIEYLRHYQVREWFSRQKSLTTLGCESLPIWGSNSLNPSETPDMRQKAKTEELPRSSLDSHPAEQKQEMLS